MAWKLWLDDQLDDPDAPLRHTPEGFLGARDVEEAKALVIKLGVPDFLDLDHDLGSENAMEFLKWLVYEYGCESPPDYTIHSANSVGAANLDSFMRTWKKASKL